MPTELRELNQLVTLAIMRAEQIADGSSAALVAYHEVSQLEEQIAALTSNASAEGAFARDGAVRAALRSDEPLRAAFLAERYIEEDGVPDRLRAALSELLRQAQAALPNGDADVQAVEFQLAA
ncbi:MAG: hypothetical protein ACHREM_01545 [Polyangiales bacterium]